MSDQVPFMTCRRPRYQAGARFNGGPKGPPALLHAKSTRRSVWRRSFSCSLEQHQCRPSCRASPHTTHSPAAWRCRRSSGSLDHRASPRRSHASASRRLFLAAYSRSFASARHRSWRTTGSRSRSEYRHDTPKCTADVGQHGRDVLVAFAGQEPMAATAPKCGKCCKPLTFLGPQSDSS